ncbi:MAG: hypothetical protein BMS9Abin26_1216 [Gammaproteobacteria bacterium]|nr:MAG: hypothetical protein BMS9Abin26_1216 [Gammaproteobacteria bacterium]
MLLLSEVMIANPQLQHFTDLLETIKVVAVQSGEIQFRIDVKPAYPDTPDNWEDRLEGAFCGVYSVTQ